MHYGSVFDKWPVDRGKDVEGRETDDGDHQSDPDEGGCAAGSHGEFVLGVADEPLWEEARGVEAW